MIHVTNAPVPGARAIQAPDGTINRQEMTTLVNDLWRLALEQKDACLVFPDEQSLMTTGADIARILATIPRKNGPLPVSCEFPSAMTYHDWTRQK